MWTFELYRVMCLSVFFVFTNHCRAQKTTIECIPLEDCPVAMKLIATKKFAAETIQFLKNSHCGYSEMKEPLVWCPNLNYCTTPDGKNGTCTDIVKCHYLLNAATTTNFLKEYRCNNYLRNSVFVCCPEDTGKMQNRFLENDDSDHDDTYIFDKPSSFSARSSVPNGINWKEENIYLKDQPRPSTKPKFLHNRIDEEFPKHRHHDQVHRLNHNYHSHNKGFNVHEQKEFGNRDRYENSYVPDEDSSNSLGYEGREGSFEGNIYSDRNTRGGYYNPRAHTLTSRKPYWITNPPINSPTAASSREPYWTTQSTNASRNRTTSLPRSIETWNEHENITNKNENKTNIFENISSICGRQTANDNKIIGGSTADLGEYPWMALLQYTSNNGKKFGCGGSLISKRHVLTAAHCVNTAFLTEKRLKLYNVILGEYDTRNDTDCIYLPFGKDCADPAKIYEIESVIEHRKFSSANGTDDIALIVLDREVDFTDYVKPICLPSKTFAMKTNESLTVAGWGKTTTSESFSPVLKKAKLPNVEKGTCEQFGKSLTRGQICAGFGNGVDTCTGDSGGPLMISRAQNFEFVTYQIGVVSYGFVAEGCGSAPSVNTFVPYYIDWINDNVS